MKKVLILLIMPILYLATTYTVHAEELRQETGVEASLTFQKDTPVGGDTITLNNGNVYRNCYFTHAPQHGLVTNGVIYPWDSETAWLEPCPLPKTNNTPKKSSPQSPTPTPDKKNNLVIGMVWVDYNNNYAMDCDNKLRCDKALSDVSVWTIATYSGYRPCEGIISITLNAKTDSY